MNRLRSEEQFRVVLKQIEVEFGVTEEELLIPNRGTSDVVWARQVACLALRNAGWTMEEIGFAIGRDHSTVCNAIAKAEVRARATATDHIQVARVLAVISGHGATMDSSAAISGAIAVLDGVIERSTRARDTLRSLA